MKIYGLALKPQIPRITQIFFCKDFFSHELTQIPTNNLIVESRGIRVSPQKPQTVEPP